MRIATLYGDINSVGRNDGGPLYYTHNLRKIFGDGNIQHILPIGDWSKHGKFDLFWMTDWGEDALKLHEFEIPHPSVYIASDTHLGYDYRLSRAKRCDYVFCNQKKAVDDFIRDGVTRDRVWWLPHAFDPLAYSPGIFNDKLNDWDRQAVPMKKYDVCFIGNLNDENRVLHLDLLFKEFPNFYWGTQRFHEASEKFNQSRIVFNVSSRHELNMRHFESLGSGSFLLTDNIPEDQNVFKEGIHFIGYSNKDEMIEKSRFFLEHPESMEKIAQFGYEEAVSKHTYLHRTKTILETLGIESPRKEELCLVGG